jgi:hypothetical protein
MSQDGLKLGKPAQASLNLCFEFYDISTDVESEAPFVAEELQNLVFS